MSPKILTSLLFMFLTTQIHSQNTFIGKWRRMNIENEHRDTTDKNLKWGDLEIRSDSSFHFEGVASTKNSRALTPGWHMDDDLNGTWQLDKRKSLILSLKVEYARPPLCYKIIKLTKEELVMRPLVEKNRKYNMKYLRL